MLQNKNDECYLTFSSNVILGGVRYRAATRAAAHLEHPQPRNLGLKNRILIGLCGVRRWIGKRLALSLPRLSKWRWYVARLYAT